VKQTFIVPWWAWAGLTLTIVVMSAVDLFTHRDGHEIRIPEASVWSGIWIAVSLGFGLALWAWQVGEVAGAYYGVIVLTLAVSIATSPWSTPGTDRCQPAHTSDISH
jgi:tellurite resistance protein TerC